MTSSRLSFRTALKSDARELIDIHFAATHAIGSDHYSNAVKFAWSPPPDAARQKWLSDLISQDSVICTVAVLDHDMIVGFCIALPSQAQLIVLYVHPNYSGLGVGYALLRWVETHCRAIGLEALELKASCNAEAFYRHSGYEVIGQTTQQLTDTLSMAATLMVKRFTPVAQAICHPDAARSSRTAPAMAKPEERLMTRYSAEILWLRGEQDFLGRRYSRRHLLHFDGGMEIPGSSSPHLVPVPMSDPAAMDPEEAFVASLSSCHMLWFLSIAAKQKFCVDRYFDSTVGVMEENEGGKMAMTVVTLRPAVTFSGECRPTRQKIDQMHHEAHENCFIANSVKSEVLCEPVYGDAS